MKTVLAIDPGNEHSAFVRWSGAEIYEFGFVPNEKMLEVISIAPPATHILLIEKVMSYGMPIGKETLETVFWSGRFFQRWDEKGGECLMIPRVEVRLNHCLNIRANDSTVCRALKDKYGVPGTKKNKGLTYGLTGHTWQAFALATYYTEILEREQKGEGE